MINFLFIFCQRQKIAAMGAFIIIFWLVIAVFAPWLAPFAPNQLFEPALLPLSELNGDVFLLGTDAIGRDILSRIMYGGQNIMLYVPACVGFSYIVGVTIGLISGYFGGILNKICNEINNIILAFPIFVLYIALIGFLNNSTINIIIAICLGSVPVIARITNGAVKDILPKNYILAAKLRGEKNLAIIFYEIFPNILPPLISDLCIRIGYIIIAIGALGFVGIGLSPNEPDWGVMINDGRSIGLLFPHIIIFPALAISSLILAFNFLADGIRKFM